MTYMISDGKRLNAVLSHPDANDTSNLSQEELTREMESYFHNWDPTYDHRFGGPRPLSDRTYGLTQ